MPEPLIIWTYDWVPGGHSSPRRTSGGAGHSKRLGWNSRPARSLPSSRPEHLALRPLGQVPFLNDGGVVTFESGAELLHPSGKSEVLMPLDRRGAAETVAVDRCRAELGRDDDGALVVHRRVEGQGQSSMAGWPSGLSVAFVKEESAEAASETVLPARPISDRINLVTERGLRMLEAELTRAQQALDAANTIEDVHERRRQSAVPFRDLRYFAERARTAQLTPSPASNDVVAFGHTVTFERDDGRIQTFRIVGEDEANPSEGTLSHGSPVALALIGKSVGDVVRLGPHDIAILSIS